MKNRLITTKTVKIVLQNALSLLRNTITFYLNDTKWATFLQDLSFSLFTLVVYRKPYGDKFFIFLLLRLKCTDYFYASVLFDYDNDQRRSTKFRKG